MKITISKQYRGHFEGNKAHITRWRNRTLLLVNQKEDNAFRGALNGSMEVDTMGMARFITAGMIELKVENDEMDIPEGIFRHLVGEKRVFAMVKYGIILS